ncbi:MAG TPA: hypothetical protein DCS17_02130 [Flavobacterium sp.]|nr:hypothetical protein [Flavobacterium sp.]
MFNKNNNSPLINSKELANIDSSIQILNNNWPDGIIFPQKILCLETFGSQLFLDCFPSLTIEAIRPLMVAAELLGTSIVISDKIIDRNNDAFLATQYGMSVQAMQLESYSLLYSIFPVNSKFWKHFRNYYAEYIEACIIEKKFAYGEFSFSKYTEELALKIGANKSAIAKANIAGLVELAKDDSLFEPLTEAVKQYLIARQIWDDISDWKEDLQSGTPSLLLARVVQEWPIKIFDESTLKNISRKIFYGGHINYVIQLACQCLDQAKELTKDIPKLAWRSIAVEELQKKFQSLSQDIEKICMKNIQSLPK